MSLPEYASDIHMLSVTGKPMHSGLHPNLGTYIRHRSRPWLPSVSFATITTYQPFGIAYVHLVDEVYRPIDQKIYIFICHTEWNHQATWDGLMQKQTHNYFITDGNAFWYRCKTHDFQIHVDWESIVQPEWRKKLRVYVDDHFNKKVDP